MDARRWMLLCLVAGVGCGQIATAPDEVLSDSAPESDSRPPVRTVVVHLRTPTPNTVIAQNDPSLGCPAHVNRGFGFRVTFAWDVTGRKVPVGYNLHVEHQGSEFAWRDIVVDSLAHTEVDCNSFVADHNLEDWRWRVRALLEDGRWGSWSEWGPFQFEACRHDDGRPCTAPPDQSSRDGT